MDIEEDIKILQEFTELDRKLRNYKVESDYDNFCERRCVAIDHILAEREENKKYTIHLTDEEYRKVIENAQKDVETKYKKRIAELEAKLEFYQWGDLDNLKFEEYMKEFIPKQKVKDNFNKLITRIKEFKDPEIKKYFSIEQIIDLLERFENKLLEDK